jgi:guanine deaminase
MVPDQRWMQLAIDTAREGIYDGQTPFGAVIVKDDRPVVAAHNIVWLTMDITAHAEIHAIRKACMQLHSIDLSGCTIYSTCEPCPMCFSACHWARLDRIIFAAGIADARAAGFSELTISNQQLARQGGSRIQIVAGFMREPATALFDEWLRSPGPKRY